jgi:hypothetical protein
MPLFTPGILGLDLLSQAAARRPLAVSALVVRCQRAGGLDRPVAPSTVEAQDTRGEQRHGRLLSWDQ